MAFDKFFDAIFGFMLGWEPLYAILALSLLISVLIVLIYKYSTDQKEMKQIKEQLQDYQKKMKQIKGDPEKLMKVQKEAMSTNMKYMGKSMKPTLITFIPIILIFGWMNTNFAFEPITPGQQFELTTAFEKEITGNATITVPEGLETIDGNVQEIKDRTATFKLKGKEGEYYATIASNGQEIDKHVIVTEGRKYAPVIETYKSDVFKTAQLNNKSLKVIWKLSWFWAYIISAIAFSMALRKALKVY